MVADDDPGILDVMKIMLEDVGGYEVETTTDGESVLEIQHDYPDLILLDLWMSGINGSEVCKTLKNNEETKAIPVIIFSANRDVGIISKSVAADDYIAKPFQMSDLLAKVARLI
ncbi:response regulator receiver modulated metal dependent phosphohydrolase [Fulvivirga imtechensis AK7]|uniref:Response regulator receiver modulated metal dependent phosphohydrolase n=1 Tax=Fulvivirga imtechensis AK7 TaxID=1237149 RepID=L8JQ95_9BACT|nr:response regulator [Fulvivirga imtechensis]ELR71126.1 response regulator receiver modulated metal dependent phosphohydrolase [Fulvivirga imtechensis AK7]